MIGCFSRLSPNLWCLFQALSIQMCFTADYLQHKRDLTYFLISNDLEGCKEYCKNLTVALQLNTNVQCF